MARPRPPLLEIERIGLRRRLLGDLYHFLLNSSWRFLLGLILVGFLVTNFLFALGYHYGGTIANANSFSDQFFFSVQTMATIGYGQMAPITLFANVLVTIEALTGLLSLALITGLVFSKFSRPTARVLFSKVAVIARRDGVPALMFRMANERTNQIVEAHLRVALLRTERTPEGETVRRFHELELVRSHTVIFALTWTAVHNIDERSPLAKETPESLAGSDGQIIVSLTGIDDTFAQTVIARHAYALNQTVWGARFVDILQALPDGRRAVDYSRFHEVATADFEVK